MSKIDLFTGAIGIRISRKLKSFRNKPDIVHTKGNLYFGGTTSYLQLQKAGITSILDLRAESPQEKISNNLLKYKKIKIIDGDVPSALQSKIIITWLEDTLNQGEKVFVHCNLGRGRATLVTALYLIHEGLSLDETLNIIKKRKFVYLNNKQLDFLKNFKDMHDKKEFSS